jgi:uncharacterized membrane protein
MGPSDTKYFRWILNLALSAVFSLEIFARNLSPFLLSALIALAAVASIAALQRQLPLQNVLLAAAITALVGGAAHGLSANPNLSIPFGPLIFNPDTGAKIFNSVPWIIPLLWIVAIFSARGVARLILRPWRKTKNYGWWLIGVTAVLAVAFDLALEPYAQVKHFWRWQPTKISATWCGASPLNFLGWIFISLLILAFATPSLIKKQPGSSSAPDFHPLFVWLGALLLFAVGAAGAGFWWPVGVDAAIAVITVVFAVRGARW